MSISATLGLAYIRFIRLTAKKFDKIHLFE